MSPKLELAFDVGHSSIGWAVLRTLEAKASARAQSPAIEILGCGAVIFRADDCLASSRRAYRRQRRHIRSTRQRIARMKTLLLHLGVLTEAQLNAPGCAWPWKLSAQVLQGGKPLTWQELWDVLRWYAHNRGYDGNRRWSAADLAANAEDTEKEENARSLMAKHGVSSMAETFCKELGIEPLGKTSASQKRFKGLNAAFPRKIVEGEVRRMLRAHFGKLPKVDEKLERALLGKDAHDVAAWKAIPCPALKLPNRYQGALLFGQLVPRFENRIISECPISGEKVPSRNCVEFYNFRWAMQLANIRVGQPKDKDLRELKPDERKKLDDRVRVCGYFTAGELTDAVEEITGCKRHNLGTMLMHPDAKEALIVDPVQKLITSDDLAPFWKVLPERLQKRLKGKWRHGQHFTLGQIRDQAVALGCGEAFDTELSRQLDSTNTKKRKKDGQLTRESLLARVFPSKPLSLIGRAPYARPLLVKAYEQALAGTHPKTEKGCLFITEVMREAQLKKEIAQQTNNHLVRHRLLILERLVGDIIKEYAGGEKERVNKLTIEVNRDLRQMSGMTAKQKAQDLGLRIANHHHVAEKLEKALEDERYNGKPIPITAGLIRKARVAEDLGWKCPYTGKDYEPKHLVSRYVDRDHIVPRSERASDSLDSLAITFSAVNRWKGKRTAYQFVSEEQGKPVPDMENVSIMSLTRYKQFVEGLETYKGHDDDKKRKKRRKELLQLPAYEEKEFTPRDLTQTSQLVRLGAQILKRAFSGSKELPTITSLPGSVTGAVRKAWKVLGCLSAANPQVLDANGDVKSKTDIRDITHLHHGLDACVLGLTSHFIPNNGRVWELILKRPERLTESERTELGALGVFGFTAEKRFELTDLSKELKKQIADRLAEKRVAQHIPARMEGLRVEQNTWRVLESNEDEATIQQTIRQPDGTRLAKPPVTEKVTKLLGLKPTSGKGKLAANKGVLVIPENYGVALDPQPTIIPFHNVHKRLVELKKANNGKQPRVLRNGQVIHVPTGRYKGTWRVFSAKASLTIDLGSPDKVRLDSKGTDQRREVQIKTLLRDGMVATKTPLTGLAAAKVSG